MMDFGGGLPIENREKVRKLDQIGKVILVGSGKGGVGKSLVASGLAITLSREGYRTAILDLDIHGASLPHYLGVRPPLKSCENGLEPKRTGRLKVMSIGLLTGNNAVPLRGTKKQELIVQLFSVTNWGKLDYLVVDLPPGTGDEVLSAFELFSDKCSLILVTTPSPNALNVVSRLAKLARIEHVAISGIVVNMAYSKVGRRISYLFGRIDSKILEKLLDSSILAKIPLVSRVNTQNTQEILRGRNEISRAMKALVNSLIA
jgi:ATP-binding protein involved in chromosome partitioning